MATFSRSMQHLHVLVLGTLLALTAATPAFAAATTTKTNTLPPACLRDATALCKHVTTNALQCLVDLAEAGDARVSKACATALPALRASKTSATKPLHGVNSRLNKLTRLLSEGPALSSTANCANNPQHTGTIANGGKGWATMGKTTTGFSCGNVCCKFGSQVSTACCFTYTASVNVIFCITACG